MEFALVVDLPSLTQSDRLAVSSGSEVLTVNGTVDFDTGFDRTDRLGIHAAFDAVEKRWIHLNAGIRVDILHAPNVAGRSDGR